MMEVEGHRKRASGTDDRRKDPHVLAHAGKKEKKSKTCCTSSIKTVLLVCLIFIFIGSLNLHPFQGAVRGFSQISDNPLFLCRKLSLATYHDCLGEHAIALIEVYEPTCGHCKTVMSEFEKAAGEMHLALFSIDASQEPRLLIDLGVKDIPCLLVHRLSKPPVIYSGKRTALSVSKYIKRLAKASKIVLPKNQNYMMEGTLKASGSNPSHPASNAVDNTKATTWVSAGQLPANLTVSFTTPQLFFGYSLKGPNIGADGVYLQPGSWSLFASSGKGQLWHLLDRQNPGCVPEKGASICLGIEPTQKYTQYRLVLDTNAGKRTHHRQDSVALSDWKLHNSACRQKIFGPGEVCPPLPDQRDFHEPEPDLGRQGDFACYVLGGFDDARAQVIIGLMIAAEAQKSEFVIDDVAQGIYSVYNLPATRTALEEIMHGLNYDIQIEYGHPNSLCEANSRAACEMKVQSCSPINAAGTCSLATQDSLLTRLRAQWKSPTINTGICYGSYSFDYLKTPVFATSPLAIKLNRAFVMNARILQLAEEGLKMLGPPFACIHYDTTMCMEKYGDKKEDRKACIREDIKSRMPVAMWAELSKALIEMRDNTKLSVFIHGQNHIVPSGVPHGKKDTEWDLLKRGKPKVKPKKKDRASWKNMAISAHGNPRDEATSGKQKNQPRTAEFLKNIEEAFVSGGLVEDKYTTKTMEDVVWVHAGNDFRNDIAQRREDEMRGAVAWQICSSASVLWMDASSPFSHTLAAYLCGSLKPHDDRQRSNNAVDGSDYNAAKLLRRQHLSCNLEYMTDSHGGWIRVITETNKI